MLESRGTAMVPQPPLHLLGGIEVTGAQGAKSQGYGWGWVGTGTLPEPQIS